MIGFGHERSLRRQLTAQWQFDKEKKRNELILNRNLPKSPPGEALRSSGVDVYTRVALFAASLCSFVETMRRDCFTTSRYAKHFQFAKRTEHFLDHVGKHTKIKALCKMQ